MRVEFPIKYIEDNLAFGHNKTVWAYFKVDGFSYDFLDHEEKKIPFQRQLAFLTNSDADLHFLVLPNPTNVGGILDDTIEEMKRKEYALRENGIEYMEQVKDVLERYKSVNESNEYNHYLGIQLNKEANQYETSNTGLNMINNIKSLFKGFTSPVYNAVGLTPDDILESEIEGYKKQASVIGETLSSSFSSIVNKVGTEELIQIVEKTYSTRNNSSDILLRKDLKIADRVEGMTEEGTKHKAIRVKDNGFLELQDTNITEHDARTLILSRVTEDLEEEELFVRYLTVGIMDDVQHHPGFEWLYNIQSSMPFPITVSIRADHQDNEIVKKKLSNIRLEFEDQRREAHKGSNRVSQSLKESEQGAIQMESFFQKTGYPAYSSKIIFKITGDSKESITIRSETLKKELSKYGIKIIAPYGEQIQLMMDSIPTSKKINNDYLMEFSPSVLASLMFGATTNIGDNRGFYIGQTSQFGKPVFIQPDLAAKAYEGLGNVVESLSTLVAGATGKGKSFFMNLFVYLSTLTGSSALIIDPKGDRKGWVDGLPYINKEFIEIWTLGSDENDAGSLDPFRTSTSMQEAKNITMDVLSYLANVDIDDTAYTLLNESVEKASLTKDPCIWEVVAYLKNLFNNKPDSMSDKRYGVLEDLIGTLDTLKDNSLSMLLFGEPNQRYKVLEHSKPLQVLMIQNLSLPSSETKKLRVNHKISEAIMISITAWTKQYMFKSERSKHKIILQDEASSIERNAMGSELMDFIVRQGRYYNTTLLKGSQNATDHGNNVANMGMKFTFGLRLDSEIKEMLNYLNLPVTRNNIDKIRGLDRGEAIFQDIFGRSATVKINPIFDDLFEAFNSSTATKEERERELEHTK